MGHCQHRPGQEHRRWKPKCSPPPLAGSFLKHRCITPPRGQRAPQCPQAATSDTCTFVIGKIFPQYLSTIMEPLNSRYHYTDWRQEKRRKRTIILLSKHPILLSTEDQSSKHKTLIFNIGKYLRYGPF